MKKHVHESTGSHVQKAWLVLRASRKNVEEVWTCGVSVSARSSRSYYASSLQLSATRSPRLSMCLSMVDGLR
jgi:hypothetical protein